MWNWREKKEKKKSKWGYKKEPEKLTEICIGHCSVTERPVIWTVTWGLRVHVERMIYKILINIYGKKCKDSLDREEVSEKPRGWNEARICRRWLRVAHSAPCWLFAISRGSFNYLQQLLESENSMKLNISKKAHHLRKIFLDNKSSLRRIPSRLFVYFWTGSISQNW